MGGKTLQVSEFRWSHGSRQRQRGSQLVGATLTECCPFLNPSWFLLTHTQVAAAGRTVSAGSPHQLCHGSQSQGHGMLERREHSNCLARSLNFTHRTN